MLSLPFAICLLFLFVTPTASQPFRRSSAEVRREVIGVVESQFTAFKDGDYARAYSFAAAGIQQQFNVTAFERMVKNGYPIIASNNVSDFALKEAGYLVNQMLAHRPDVRAATAAPGAGARPAN